MDDLAERIKSSLEDPNGEPWFPELTGDLVARAWDNLHRDIGLTPDNYSTERVQSRSISAPREIIASLKTCRTNCTTSSAISVEALSPKTLIKYRDQGANFYSQQELLDSTCLSCLEDALAIISEVPSLMTTVCAFVRSIHVIKPEDADYDISFSEPHVPFSIFASVPQKRVANDTLRVAEALIHESMHLQLTIIEHTVPLVKGTQSQVFSPWRGTYRSARGVLHGTYVFRVIEQFLSQSHLLNNLAGSTRQYSYDRVDEIGLQIKAIEGFQLSPDLSPSGSSFVMRLLG